MRRYLFVAALACLPAIAIVGCGSDAVAPLPSTNLNGTWITADEVPGSSNIWTLTVAGSTVTGTGTWSGEACCGGTIAITGAITNGGVHLDLTLLTTVGNPRPPVHEQFDGSLTSPDVLQGVIAIDNGAASTRLVRQPVEPPTLPALRQ
jgi:hypothetical protein